MKKLLLINFLYIFLFVILLEITSIFLAMNEFYKNEKEPAVLKRCKGSNIIEAVINTYKQKPFLSYEDAKSNLHPVIGREYTKKRIILFGCSVTYGNLLNENKNFSGVLSKITKRPVYNMAFDGWGPSHMLKLIREDRSLIFGEEPEYIIYTYINDHKRRIISHQGWPYSSQLYKIYDFDKNSQIIDVPRKYPNYWRFLSVKHIQCLYERLILRNEKYINSFLYKILEESATIIKKRYPNTKLIMLLYDVKICLNKENTEISKINNIISDEEYKKFKELGFEVYSIEELAGKSFCGIEYHAKCPIYGDIDYNHPSTKMWEEFVPKLVEKLNM